jgi:hypothetical protein
MLRILWRIEALSKRRRRLGPIDSPQRAARQGA